MGPTRFAPNVPSAKKILPGVLKRGRASGKKSARRGRDGGSDGGDDGDAAAGLGGELASLTEEEKKEVVEDGDEARPPEAAPVRALLRRRSENGAPSLRTSERTEYWRTGSRTLQDDAELEAYIEAAAGSREGRCDGDERVGADNDAGAGDAAEEGGSDGDERGGASSVRGEVAGADKAPAAAAGDDSAPPARRRAAERRAGVRRAPVVAVPEFQARSSLRLRRASTAEVELVRRERFMDWAGSFRRLDPRFRIRRTYDDVALWGADASTLLDESLSGDLGGGAALSEDGTPMLPPAAVSEEPSDRVPALLRMFRRSGVFTVWRPCRMDAIRKMMAGEAVGKGLDVKGKSAIRGDLSGFVPFVQIHKEEHKDEVRTPSKAGRIRVYYKLSAARDGAAESLRAVSEEMAAAVQDAKDVLGDGDPLRSSLVTPAERDAALRRMSWDVADPSVEILDHCADKGCYGVEVAERVFWEAYVVRQNISRQIASGLDTGRDSVPCFQDMNLASMRREVEEGEPRPVVWQHAPADDADPLGPQTLLMAYEERGRVLPVVSDFDCFLVGTRGVSYDEPLPPEQVDTLRWCVDHIERILDGPDSSHGWSTRWFHVIKGDSKKKLPPMPRFGYADPKSTAIVQYAVSRLRTTGAVRHGAECFNFYFPQDLDDEYLFVGDDGIGGPGWKYVTRSELREILGRKIDEGFTFPLNPKWILCDSGWKDVFDRLSASKCPLVRQSLDAWYPPGSGIREKFESICARHPDGFRRRAFDGLVEDEEEIRQLCQLPSLKRSVSAVDMAIHMLDRHEVLQRAKRKLRAAMIWIRFLRALRERAGEGADPDAAADDADAMHASCLGDLVEFAPPPPPSLSSSSRPSPSLHWTAMGTDSFKLA